MHRDAGVLGTPARTLTDLPAKVPQREIQAGQIGPPPASLRAGLMADRRARYIRGLAVPEALVVNQIVGRLGDDPSGAREVTEHLVFVAQVRQGGQGVIAPQDNAPSIRHLQQPAPVLERDVLERDNPARLKTQGIDDAIEHSSQSTVGRFRHDHAGRAD